MDDIDREVIRFKVMNKVRRLAEAYDEHRIIRKLEAVDVIEHRRRSSRSGVAKDGREVQMNLLLCDTEDQYEQTFAHEMAHIFCQLVWPGRRVGHGREWKMAMRWLGYPAERCHDIDMSKRVPERWTKVACDCGRECQLGPRQSVKLRRGITDYFCRCGRPLRL